MSRTPERAFIKEVQELQEFRSYRMKIRSQLQLKNLLLGNPPTANKKDNGYRLYSATPDSCNS
jgi:hypothetical protein